MPMAINFGKVGIYNESFYFVKPPGPLIKWSWF